MLHIFTYGAGNISRFEYLKASADFCSMNINYITQTDWNGYFDKIKNMINAIKGLPDNDLVCFVDGFDVIAVGGEDEIKTKFLQYDCDVLFGAELNCWPGEYLGRFPNMGIKNGYKYLNSGGFIGYKHAVLEMYTWKHIEEVAHICKTRGGDQGYLTEYFIDNYGKKNKLRIDSNVQIFQNFFSLDWNEIYIKGGRFVNPILNSTPCFLHFNGDSYKTCDGKNIMPVIIEQLEASADSMDEVFTLAEFRQNFSHYYFKRNQL